MEPSGRGRGRARGYLQGSEIRTQTEGPLRSSGRGRACVPLMQSSISTTTTTTITTTQSTKITGNPTSLASTTLNIESSSPMSAVTGLTTSISKVNIHDTGSHHQTSNGSSNGCVDSESLGVVGQSRNIPLTLRPDYGKFGKEFRIHCNYFRMKINGDAENMLRLYQYRIEISNEFKTMKQNECRELFWQVMIGDNKPFDVPWKVIYDGGNAFYSVIKLPTLNTSNKDIKTYELMLSTDMRRTKYTVATSFVGRIAIDVSGNYQVANENSFHAIKFLDLLFRQYYSLPDKFFENQNKQFVNTGRSFYYIPKSDKDFAIIGHNTQAWRGYFLASKFSKSGSLYLNFNTSCTAFYSPKSVLEFVCSSLNATFNTQGFNTNALKSDTTLTELQRRAVDKEIKGLTVVASHSSSSSSSSRVYRVIKCSELCADELKFDQRSKGKDQITCESITVAAYFAKAYTALRFPRLPCLVCGTKKRQVFLPMEVCRLYQPQKYNKKLNEMQTSAMIKAACCDAPKRQEQICEMLNLARLNDDPFLKSFGVKVDNTLTGLKARLLNPPSILFDSNFMVQPRQGSWSVDRNRLFEGASLSGVGYALISLAGERAEATIQDFIFNLSQTATQMGVKNFQNPVHTRTLHGIEQLEPEIKLCVQNNCTFVIVVLEKRNSQQYAEVKRMGDVVCGVVTQVVLLRAVNDRKPTTLSNIVLKINAKLGGINSLIMSRDEVQKILLEDYTMIMGIDVTHPGPTDRQSPSIAAVVANIEPKPSRFAASIRVQKFRREGLVYLQEAVQERILDFYTHASRAPTHVIIYRDGVSEGQFQEVLREELSGIREAFKNAGIGSVPPITFVVVQKRHHTRFFAEPNFQCGKARNVPPGTVVDTEIVHPTHYDFFLCSHFGIQGTSRPAHYHVLLDENNFTADQMQSITYFLSHVYARCTRSVSIPAPVYYAHLACARARYHLYKVIGTEDSSSIYSGGDSSSSAVTEENLTRACKVNEQLRQRMYFC